MKAMGLGVAAMGVSSASTGQTPPKIQGFEEAPVDPNAAKHWKPVSDRKIRVGIVGYGLCRFGAAFSFQDHPNVEVTAVSDLFPDRCRGLAQACRCEKTYPSLEKRGRGVFASSTGHLYYGAGSHLWQIDLNLLNEQFHSAR